MSLRFKEIFLPNSQYILSSMKAIISVQPLPSSSP